MGNICTRSITEREYQELTSLLYNGFKDKDDRVIKPNIRTAVALVTMANLGVRVGDVVRLRLSDFYAENGRYRLKLSEQKTGKKRHFAVNTQVYTYLQDYAIDMGISKDARLFDISVRAIQRNLKQAVDHLGLIDVSTHSYRKFCAGCHYEKTKDIRLIQQLLQHASVNTTVRYLTITQEKIDAALDNHLMLPNQN